MNSLPSETMREHYSTVGLDERRAGGVRSVQVLRYVPERGSADSGADVSTPANDTAQAEPIIAAK